MNIIKKLKPGIPKRGLLYVATLIWAFVSFRIISIGVEDIFENTLRYWIFIPIGVVLSLPFFRFFFLRISRKHIKRMLNAKSERPCLFSFFDVKSYLIMMFMIALGISIQKLKIVPLLYVGTFYISLGLSLFFSAMCFFVSGVRYKQCEKEIIGDLP